jgi:hypothetical protein
MDNALSAELVDGLHLEEGVFQQHTFALSESYTILDGANSWQDA